MATPTRIDAPSAWIGRSGTDCGRGGVDAAAQRRITHRGRLPHSGVSIAIGAARVQDDSAALPVHGLRRDKNVALGPWQVVHPLADSGPAQLGYHIATEAVLQTAPPRTNYAARSACDHTTLGAAMRGRPRRGPSL